MAILIKCNGIHLIPGNQQTFRLPIEDGIVPTQGLEAFVWVNERSRSRPWGNGDIVANGRRRGGTMRLLTMWRRGVQPPPAHHLPTVPSGLVRRSTPYPPPEARPGNRIGSFCRAASARSAHRKVRPTLRIPDTLNTRQHEEEKP